MTAPRASAVSPRSLLVVLPTPAGADAVARVTIAGLPLLRRIVLAAERAGFERVLVHRLACPDARLLESTGAGVLGLGAAAADGPARVVLLPANVLPQTRWLHSLREAPLPPDTLELDPSVVAAIESGRPGDILEAAAGAATAEDLIGTLSRHLTCTDRSADPAGRFPLATAADAGRAEAWLLRSLIKDAEGFMSRHVERPLSLALTRRLVATRMTPNAMTFVSLAVGLLGAPFFLSSELAGQLTGALLFLTHSILDGCDGELARLKFLESRYGALLDFWGDNLVHVAVFGCMAFGWTLASDTAWPILVGALAVIGTATAALTLSRQVPQPAHGGAAADVVARLTGALANRDFIYVVVALSLIGRAYWFLVPVAAGTPIFVMLVWWADRRAERFRHRQAPRPWAAGREQDSRKG
jgi:phosphatidylglycerophosphate synthase